MLLNAHVTLKNKLSELHTDEHTFFRIAHCYFFGTTPDLHNDVARYKVDAVIPNYVINYLRTLGGET